MREEMATTFAKLLAVLVTTFFCVLFHGGLQSASAASGQAGCCVFKGQCFFPETQKQCNRRGIPNKWDGCRQCNAAGTDCGDRVDPKDQTFCYCVSAKGTILRFAEHPDECKADKGESFKCIKQSEQSKSAEALGLNTCQEGADCSSCAVDVCRVVEITPTHIVVEAQDGDGLAVISVLDSQNAQTIVPSFSPGTTESVLIRSTKIDPSFGSRVSLLVIDSGCPCAAARICDPLLTTVLRATGRPVSESYSGLPQEEDTVTIVNGRPGLNHLDIYVNGIRFRVNDLGAEEERTIDVSAAMLSGDVNMITLKTQGKPGTSATVLLWDGAQ